MGKQDNEIQTAPLGATNWRKSNDQWLPQQIWHLVLAVTLMSVKKKSECIK